MCAWICLAMDLVRGPRRSSSMDSLLPSRPRRSLLGARRSSWSRRSSWFGPWLPWLDASYSTGKEEEGANDRGV
ncbi:hypothetical protein VNO80_30644 [Phaseolus coccineus]|uniref:Uncharacterized protein n=1 Tax=Phaseolus coccineus TaxID=3886 RepID=A0AAN9LGP2_PHACN